MKRLTLCIVLFVVTAFWYSESAGQVKSAGVKGNWSSASTWIGGALPKATDEVIIANDDTVTYDMGMALNTTIAGLTIGEGASGILQMTKTDSTKLAINGNLLIKKGAVLKAQSNTLTGVQGCQHLIVLTRNLTYQGALFDARVGTAGSSLAVINFEFVGPLNTIITMSPDTSIMPANFEFNSIKINKSGTANVILNSDIYCASGSSSAPNQTAFFTFVKGKVLNNTVITTTTTGANISGYSDSSYVVGAMGRGMSSSVTTRDFCIGDAKAYRPMRLRGTSISGTGHYFTVRLIPGNANTGTSKFGPGIDKVSSARYYQITYNQGSQAVTSLGFVFAHPSYRDDDGVVGGSTNLRVAVSTDNRANWINLGPTTATVTTKMDSLPRILLTDTLATTSAIMLNSGQSAYIALARAAGTTDNSLDPPATAVFDNDAEVPTTFSVMQNYPNPFNPTTNIRFSIEATKDVTLKVVDVLGREVATLVSQTLAPGTYTVKWDASSFPSGVYFYTVRAGGQFVTQRMMLTK